MKVSSGELTNSGTLTAQAGGPTPRESEIVGSVTNTGTVAIDADADYFGAGAVLDNKGPLRIADDVTFNDEQTVIDDTGGEIAATGSGQLLTGSNNGVYDQGDGTTSGTEPVLLDGHALDYTGAGQSTISIETGIELQGSLAAGPSLTALPPAGSMRPARSPTRGRSRSTR